MWCFLCDLFFPFFAERSKKLQFVCFYVKYVINIVDICYCNPTDYLVMKTWLHKYIEYRQYIDLVMNIID